VKYIRKIGGLFLSLNKFFWNKTTADFRKSRIGLAWGRFIFSLVLLRGGRNQLTTTYFFRNRAELQMFTDIANALVSDTKVKITIIGCSSGAEVYSIIYTIKKNIPSFSFELRAFDIDSPALENAKAGIYPIGIREFSQSTDEELNELFTNDGVNYKVRDEFKKNISWELNDPTREPVISSLPKQDLVIANRLLFHMNKKEQYRAMTEISSMVRAGGYISVVGADLDVRTSVAKDLGWIPLTDYIDDMHAGDETMTCDWPFEYWGLEPMDKNRKDWKLRYCSFFQKP